MASTPTTRLRASRVRIRALLHGLEHATCLLGRAHRVQDFRRRSQVCARRGSASASGPSFNSVTIALFVTYDPRQYSNCRRRFRVGLPTFRRYCDGLSIQRLLACIWRAHLLARRHSCAPLLRTLEQDPYRLPLRKTGDNDFASMAVAVQEMPECMPMYRSTSGPGRLQALEEAHTLSPTCPMARA